MEHNKIAVRWLSLKNQFGHRRVTTIAYLLIIGVSSLCIHALFIGGLGQSALLYMLVPYAISLVIASVRSYEIPETTFKEYIHHIVTVTLVFLATSIVLREGFVCVIFFFPIYFIFVSLAFAVQGIRLRKAEKNNRLRSVAIPILIILMSLEGTSDMLSFERSMSVRVSKETSLSVDEIKANLASPFDLNKNRHWILSIFPMPYHIEAGSLNTGDVHKIKTRYQRWFITNTHEGQAELLIEHVGPDTVRTKLLNDTTYFSSYLKLLGTQIEFQSLETGGTEITLQINFERKLDPAWYFQFLQKIGVSKMAEFLIDEVMIRER